MCLAFAPGVAACHIGDVGFRLPLLAGLAFALATILSVQAISLLRDRAGVAQQANAARLDEIARTSALRVEYQLLSPMATAVGRAMFGDSDMAHTPDVATFAAHVRQYFGPCACARDDGLAIHVRGGTARPILTSDHGDGRWLADTLMRQIHVPHLASYNMVGHGNLGVGKFLLGFLTTSPPEPIRLFAYGAHLAPADTILDLYAVELAPTPFIARALSDSTVNPGTDTGALAFRAQAVTLDVTDAAGRSLYRSPGVRWDPGLRVRAFPTDIGRLGLRIYAVRPVSKRPSGGEGLLLVLALFGITVILSAVAVLQLRGEHALARRRARFVSGVSHELRTPLAQIRMFAELLRDESPRVQAKRYEYARIIDEEAQRLTYLVDNVLAYSALEGTGVAWRTRPVSLSDIVRDTIDRFAPLAASRSAHLETIVPDGVVVSADDDAIRRIVLNVLDNAVKYGPAGQTVRIELRVADHTAHLTVDDAGPGIPMGDRRRVFEPFVRLENGQGQDGGSGIGLAIVRDLVARLQGTVAIEDAPSGGTRVRLTLPT